MPGLRKDVGFGYPLSGVTELHDVVPVLWDGLHHCYSGVDELRLGLVPELQVACALSPAG